MRESLNKLFMTLASLNASFWLLATIVANPVEVGRVCLWLFGGFLLLALITYDWHIEK